MANSDFRAENCCCHSLLRNQGLPTLQRKVTQIPKAGDTLCKVGHISAGKLGSKVWKLEREEVLRIRDLNFLLVVGT